MTREERAREALAKHGLVIMCRDTAYQDNVSTGDAILASMLVFADAEIERAVQVAQDEADDIRAAGMDRDTWQQGRMMMADVIARGIREMKGEA